VVVTQLGRLLSTRVNQATAGISRHGAELACGPLGSYDFRPVGLESCIRPARFEFSKSIRAPDSRRPGEAAPQLP